MVIIRLFLVLFFYPILLVGCGEPFINIDIKTGGDLLDGNDIEKVQQPAPGCRDIPGIWVCPGEKVEATVLAIHAITNANAKLFVLDKSGYKNSILIPQDRVNPNIKTGQRVKVILSEVDNTYDILPVGPALPAPAGS